MTGSYKGYVRGSDPLHGFLSTIIRDRMGVREPNPAFRAYRLTGSNVVYAYEEKFSGSKIICKFYGPKFGPDRDRAASMAHQEYQGAHARGELHRTGLLGYFDPIVVSGDYGYRKPDRRLFQFALDGMNVAAGNALYVGNDMHRDIFGAREAGLATVMFDTDQGTKDYRGCVPDYTITDLRDLLTILGLP